MVRAAAEQARARGKGPGGFGAFALPPEDTFPGYQLLREIHRGGQGIVYQALHKGTKRKVAIKVMREGPLSSPKERVRFEREIEILSALNHPNIVGVRDSGQVNGMSYFVMEYISGLALDAFVQESGRTVEDVLRLFVKVCDAVNAAHLRGVIHRDLKPGNIRVDANGEPHILDFGLARTAIGDTSGGDTPKLMTMTGQFVGSLPWASPEQAEGHSDKIDVRTDVYSLGVILYQLLTGAFPYEVVGAMRDVMENILRASPARPSTIRRRINDEVETIVLTCLSKERERRYQSAGELARDLRNYLGGQPIEAKRDSGLYVIRKTLKRYKAQTLAAAAVLLAIAGGGVVAAVMYARAERQRVIAVEATATAEGALHRAREVAGFLDGMFGLIDPDVAQGSDTTVVQDMLREAGAAIDTRLTGQPDIAAAVRDTIGAAYLRLGKLDLAERNLAAALAWRQDNLGEMQLDTARSLFHVADLKCARGTPDDLAEARRLAARSMHVREAMLGARHPEVAECVNLIGYAWKLQGDHERAREQYGLALAMQRESLGADSLAEADTLTNLGEMYFDQRRFTEAIDAMTRAVAIREMKLDAGSTAIATARQSLASFLRERNAPGDAPRAEALFSQAIGALTRLVDPAHPFLAATRNKFGLFLLEIKGDPGAAETVLSENLTLRAARLGDRHRLVAVSRMNLSKVYLSQGRLAECEATLEEARGKLDPRDAYYPTCTAKLVEALALRAREEVRAGAGPRAEEMLVRAGGMADATLIGNAAAPPAHAWKSLDALCAVLDELGQRERAVAILTADAGATRARLGPAHERTAQAEKRLADFTAK